MRKESKSLQSRVMILLSSFREALEEKNINFCNLSEFQELYYSKDVSYKLYIYAVF